MPKLGRRTISVRRSTYALLFEFAHARGRSVSDLVERAVAEYMQAPTTEPPTMPPPACYQPRVKVPLCDELVTPRAAVPPPVRPVPVRPTEPRSRQATVRDGIEPWARRGR